ncbi:MAG: type V CRISPR-associated endonuclease Cas1 [Candidatus Omnitrophica bacterium]|nr:type V CRISPR-associated endonuclease Cas1 [Candidatus Omnitrophota bacterium]
MLSLPDFKEKQLLFITAQEATDNIIRFKNENICLVRDGKIINQLSCHKVFAVFIIGDCSITTVLIRNCQRYGVSLFLLKNNLGLYAQVIATADGNYLLRQKQYAITDDLTIAKHIVINKISNQYKLLSKIDKENNYQREFEQIKNNIQIVADNQELLGIEGNLSKKFFSQYFSEIDWYKRLPQTKVDAVNLLLDLGYTLLFNFIDALLGLYGFDNYKGFYHKLFFQRKSLVCDIMEPFRCIIDYQILKSYHLKQIDKKDFRARGGRYELLFDKQQKYLQIFSSAIIERKEQIFNYVRQFYYCIINDTNNYPIFDFQ